jgi:hypothetical protein
LSADIGARAPTSDPKVLKIAPIKYLLHKNWTVKKPSSVAQIFNFLTKILLKLTKFIYSIYKNTKLNTQNWVASQSVLV